ISFCFSLFTAPIPPSPSSTLFPYTTLFRSFARFFRPHYGGIVRVPGTGVGARLGRIEERTRAERSTGLAGTADDLDEAAAIPKRSEEHTSELQSRVDLVCRLLLEKKKKTRT